MGVTEIIYKLIENFPKEIPNIMELEVYMQNGMMKFK